MSNKPATAAELLGHANGLLKRVTPQTRGLWPRAAAFLARQALEQSLDDYWRTKSLPLGECSKKAQLLCLPEYLRGSASAQQAHHIWRTLSRACHQHPYELAPTVAELEGWVEVVTSLSEDMRGAARS